MHNLPDLSIRWQKSRYGAISMAFLLIGLVAYAVLLPYEISGDGQVRYQFMETLVSRFQITPMKYSLVGPLFSLPLWLVSSLPGLSKAVLYYNLILLAILLGMLYRWLKDQVETPFLLTFLLLLAFGSMFPAHLIHYYGEVFSALCLALGTIALARGRSTVGWAFLFLAALNTPPLLLPLALIALNQAWECKQFRFLAMIPAAVLLLVGEAFLRTGSLSAGFQVYLNQDQGFQSVLPFSGRIGYSYPFLLGMFSILLSSGKGLLFYCPTLFGAGWLWKAAASPFERKLLSLWLLIVGGMILAYASWWSWYGGWFWGPRFFLFASLPAAWVLARLIWLKHTSWILSLVTIGFTGLAVWVSISGAVFQLETLDLCKADNYTQEYLCWYVPEFSPLVRPLYTRDPVTPDELALLGLYSAAFLWIVLPVAGSLPAQFHKAITATRSIFTAPGWRF